MPVLPPGAEKGGREGLQSILKSDCFRKDQVNSSNRLYSHPELTTFNLLAY